jgi:type I restriction enzyme M protein
MANSASDARHSEADIRKTLIEKNLIYAMLTLPKNMFYTVHSALHSQQKDTGSR